MTLILLIREELTRRNLAVMITQLSRDVERGAGEAYAGLRLTHPAAKASDSERPVDDGRTEELWVLSQEVRLL